jgi:hypothetical protein
MKITKPLVIWSMRLSQEEAAEWEELLYALRRESGVRTLNKTDIVRGPSEAAACAEGGGMTAPERVISHARKMAAFADLNRQIERQQNQVQTAAQNAAQAQQW